MSKSLTTKFVMRTAAQMCSCGYYNMPVVAVKQDDYKWNIGYVCGQCKLHEIFFVTHGMLARATTKGATRIMAINP